MMSYRKSLFHRRSCLTNSDINNYKGEITKQKNSPVCALLSTNEVAKKGVDRMKLDNFKLVKGQIDV